MELFIATADIVGKVMVAYTAIAVHHRVWKEHKIDSKVFKAMKRERIIGIVGITLMIIAYILKLPILL